MSLTEIVLKRMSSVLNEQKLRKILLFIEESIKDFRKSSEEEINSIYTKQRLRLKTDDLVLYKLKDGNFRVDLYGECFKIVESEKEAKVIYLGLMILVDKENISFLNMLIN